MNEELKSNAYKENLDLYNEADGEALLDNPLCDYL